MLVSIIHVLVRVIPNLVPLGHSLDEISLASAFVYALLLSGGQRVVALQ